MCLKALIGVSFLALIQRQMFVENFSRNEVNLDITQQPYTDTGYLTFKGSYIKTRKGRLVSAFRGITYALTRRFEPPQRPLYTTNKRVTIDATRDGKICPQAGMLQETMEENCLTLNVYSITYNPLHPTAHDLRPVMVYFHDGAFYNGSARSDVAGPQYLLDRDLVLVTVQYRIGPFGFLSTGTVDSPGNYGLKDQAVALQWVKEYIKHFGGNPDCVTIAGSGAGAESVALHMVSPMSADLFHRAIMMGGSPTAQDSLPTNQLDLARRLADSVNCPTDKAENIVDCLKERPYQALADSLSALYKFGYDPVHIWRPVVEQDFNQSRFLTDLPERSMEAGLHQRVPLMIGRTELDYAWRAYLIINDPALLKEMNEKWAQKAQTSLELGRVNETTAQKIATALRKYYLDDQPLTRNELSARRLGSAYADALTGYPMYRLVNLMTKDHVFSDKIENGVYYYEFNYRGKYSHFYHKDTGRSIVSSEARVPHTGTMRQRSRDGLRLHTAPSQNAAREQIDRLICASGDPDRHRQSSSGSLSGSSSPKVAGQLSLYGSPVLSAVHGDELIYILGMPARFPLIMDDNSNDSLMVAVMTERIYLFCLSGNKKKPPATRSQPNKSARVSNDRRTAAFCCAV
ncbi:Venom carboxylesterase-6 [Eumeta japonica]|uniref:Venom carboxylesterase-6 n=1 Tax=Eumeta variegata TaxID=151549 RepID=A0A4C1SWH3_EUMVA|nr:Venom carboxylesterase-6 [Eumeta japonica]